MSMEAAGAFLRAFRQVRRLSQEEVARKLDVNKNQPGQWERGKNTPAVDHFEAYCKVVRAPADRAMAFVGDAAATPLKAARVAARWLREHEGVPEEDLLLISLLRETYGSRSILEALRPELDP